MVKTISNFSKNMTKMTDQLYNYMIEISLREAAILAELREVTEKLPHSNMQISPEQGQFLALLVKLINAKNTLDIGVFTGYSALVVALALPKDGKVIACDIDKDTTNIAKQFWRKAKVAEKIDLKIAPALETLDKLISEGKQNSFDFAFIDADKENYPAYYEKCLILIRSGGLIAIDNMFRDGAIADKTKHDKFCTATRALQKTILKDKRVDESLVPIRDGLMLARKI